MKNFKAFTINHLQLNQLDSFVPSLDHQYLVFWWKTIPLGNLWLCNDINASDHFQFRLKVKDAIQNAIDHYASIRKQDNQYDWKKYFLNSDKKNLEEELNHIIPLVIGKGIEDLSVVICTRNRPLAIEKCVKALMESIDLDFELIVVDNAPDDDSTEQVIKKFPNVKYIKEPHKGLDIARNTGARYAKHNIIAYTDDDVIVEPSWTKLLKAAFEDPLTMAVTGLVIPLCLHTPSQCIFERDWGFNKGYLPRVFDGKYFAENLDIGVPVWDIGAGANMAFRREIFDLVGWFDERLDVGASGCSGDSEFWYRILAEGWHCNYYPHLFVYHQHRESMSSLKTQIFNYMRGQVSSLLVQYENYHHRGNLYRIYRSLPKYYFKKMCKDVLRFKFNTLTEVRGCISGWIYYHRHRNIAKNGNLLYLKKLDKKFITNNNTLVSVVIPCYNHGQYLKQAIESVLSQTHKNSEIIVVNDGSTDDTADICKIYPDVKYIYTNRLGLSGARNMGIKYSTGDVLMFLDADDFLYPKAFEINLSYFSKNKKAVFVSGAHEKIDNKGNLLPVEKAFEKREKNYESLLQGNYIAMLGTVMYRKELFYTFFFDPQLKACEDYDINLNITRCFPSLTHTEKIAAYRIHDHNMSADKNLMLYNVLEVLKRQKPFLKNQEKLDAFNVGIINWQNYYVSK